MADDVLGEPGALDQGVEIDAGFDAHLVAHEHEILGADVAGEAAAVLHFRRMAADAAERDEEERLRRVSTTKHTKYTKRIRSGPTFRVFSVFRG